MQPPQCGGQQMMYQKVTETIMAATQPNLRQQQLQHQRPPQWTNFQAQAQQHQGIAQQPHQLAYGQQVQGYQTQPALTYGQQQGLLPAPAMSQDYLSDSMAGLSVVGTAIGEKKTRKKKKVIA
ncbi:hypothetical protein K431DRAFT_286360 [Polychaeton citri CBS 116435]|uniref:Uncharacterized protein n=1 Tax=Polychaeton citri CBS 116435 TaxID=1314669 RepID=A0A9P4UPC8_9PEZI|nr:hypothetical protein K431DRAFT_286360 [Polychaeton citri CBS 116435]